jgi:hypothetical protein
MTARSDGLPPDELRALIRDVLRDLLPAVIERGSLSVPVATPAPPQVPAAPPPSVPAGVPQAAIALRPPVAPLPPAAPRAMTAAQATTASGGLNGSGTPHSGGGRSALTRPVRLETDADLRQFALEIVRLADNPARRRDLLTGRLTFTLAVSPGDAPTGEHRIETGAVTERAVQSAAKAGQRLVLGPRAVLTPLARDRALALGVPIERER